MTAMLLRKAWRDAVHHRARSALAVAALALSLTAGGTVLVAWAMVRASTVEGFRASLPVSATLVVDRADEALLDAVRAMPELAAVRARRVVSASIATDGGPRRALLRAYDRADANDIGRIAPLSGDWPPRAGRIVIERSSPSADALAIGARLDVALGERAAVALVVGGVGQDVALAPGWMEHTVYAFADAATLERLGAPPGYDELELRVRDSTASRANVRAVVARAASIARAQGRTIRRVDVPRPGEHIHAAQMSSLLATQLAFAVLALLAAALLVVNLVVATLAAERRTIGVLKTLGAGAGTVARHYLAHAAVLGAAATALALPAAALFGARYGALKLELLNFPPDAVSAPWLAWLVIAGVGILTAPIAALAPIARAVARPIAETLREDRLESDAFARKGPRLPVRAMLPRPARWALDNAFRRPRRTLLTVVALALGIAVMLAAANLRDAVVGAVDLAFASQRYDVALTWQDAPPRALVERIAATTDGIASHEVWLRAPAAALGEDDLPGATFPLLGIPRDSTLFAPVLRAGRKPRSGERDATLISRGIAHDAPDAGGGGTLDLRLGAGKARFVVTGVVDGAPQPLAFVSREALERGDRGAVTPMLVVTTVARDLSGQLEAIRRLREAFDEAGHSVARSVRPDESRRVIESHLVMVVEFLGAMGWLMLGVGAIALGSTLGIAVLEREREAGVLRALGASHRRMFALVELESLAVAVAAFLLALPLSAPVSMLLGEAFGRVMFTVASRPLPGPAAIASAFAVTVAVAMLAALVPAARAMRRPVAIALRRA